MIEAHDLVIAISNSGEAHEIISYSLFSNAWGSPR